MGYIAKERGRYRVRFRDPLGRVHSKTFVRKGDADRYLREVDANEFRGQWVDPRDAQMPLATVTLDRYGHLFPELDEAIAQAFGRSLEQASERRSRVVVNGDFGSP